jgi:hypothetical protein
VEGSVTEYVMVCPTKYTEEDQEQPVRIVCFLAEILTGYLLIRNL